MIHEKDYEDPDDEEEEEEEEEEEPDEEEEEEEPDEEEEEEEPEVVIEDDNEEQERLNQERFKSMESLKKLQYEYVQAMVSKLLSTGIAPAILNARVSLKIEGENISILPFSTDVEIARWQNVSNYQDFLKDRIIKLEDDRIEFSKQFGKLAKPKVKTQSNELFLNMFSTFLMTMILITFGLWVIGHYS